MRKMSNNLISTLIIDPLRVVTNVNICDLVTHNNNSRTVITRHDLMKMAKQQDTKSNRREKINQAK